jgi:hypothetical protein
MDMTAVDCDPKTQAGLIALARTRRVQRALAHAYLHRDQPLPTLRSSLGYMTGTTRVTDDDAPGGHRMTVLGVAWFEGVAYVVEEIGPDDAPVVYRLYLRGPRQGHLVPVHAWYDQADHAGAIRDRIAHLAPTLEAPAPAPIETWMLSTRIVQRRALRLASPGCDSAPIRKFALQLVVEPVGPGPAGRSTVTAFLSPHAQLTAAWTLAGGAALARVTFTGIPSGLGQAKDTVILLTSGGEALGA